MDKRNLDEFAPFDTPFWSNVSASNCQTPEAEAKRDAREVASKYKDEVAKVISRAKENS